MENRLYKLTRPEVEEYLKENDVVLLPVAPPSSTASTWPSTPTPTRPRRSL